MSELCVNYITPFITGQRITTAAPLVYPGRTINTSFTGFSNEVLGTIQGAWTEPFTAFRHVHTNDSGVVESFRILKVNFSSECATQSVARVMRYLNSTTLINGSDTSTTSKVMVTNFFAMPLMVREFNYDSTPQTFSFALLDDYALNTGQSIQYRFEFRRFDTTAATTAGITWNRAAGASTELNFDRLYSSIHVEGFTS